MKFKCLVLDHDDTVVNSTATIHYPCFVEYLKLYRPEAANRYSLSDYFNKNFAPGIVELFQQELGFSAADFAHEEGFWRDYVARHIPQAFPGIAELIADFRTRGGFIAVDSHSYSYNIERDYRHNGLPMPDVIYGWDLPPEERKPSPFTILKLMKDYGFSPEEILVVDDLKPGFDMARAAGVSFAAAGWAYDVPEIENFMRRECDYYCKTVADLRRTLGLENK